MISTKKCLHCSNSNIAGPHRLNSHGYVAIVLPGIKTATLNAYTCDNCGYTELFADHKGLINIRKVGRYIETDITNKEEITFPPFFGKYCPVCGSSIGNEAKFCTECGNSID
ncbi:MAG: zinc-ribbon domain-containing protein [Candidatus Hodarchaeota archaeon]